MTAVATQTDLLLQGRNLHMVFGRGKSATVALEDVNLTVHAGKVTGLVGPDGAGKTTLLRLAAGLLVPASGSMSVLGFDSVHQAHEIHERVGYMPQQFGLYEDLTVRENLDLYADLQGVPMTQRLQRYEKLLQMTDLLPFTSRHAGRLSGGMKQKLGLACCLVKSPKLLLLDEPTVGVDPVSRRDLWEIVYTLVKQDGIGVLLSTSYLDEAERCGHVIVMHGGRKLDEGPPSQFHALAKGHVQQIEPALGYGQRDVQTVMASRSNVIDATIRSGHVRVVYGAKTMDVLSDLPRCAGQSKAVDSSFEDAFMMILTNAGMSRHVPEVDESQACHKNEVTQREVMVHVDNLVKRFGKFTAVSDIGFTVHRGEIFGLLGPNGAGKSTTFRMLCGLLPATSGKIDVAGHDLRHASCVARSHLGYMAQKFSLYKQLPVVDNLRFYGKAYGLWGKRLKQRINWAMDEFGLQNRAKLPAGALPGGYKQRLAMAAAMLHGPEILFLDEPTSGADPLARREFWLRINGFAQQGVTVIVTTHFMEEAEYCDRMLIMSRGTQLAMGTPSEIRALGRDADHPDPTIEDAFITLAQGASHG